MKAGSRLGPYEIVSQIGAGGMGEVYRARDTRLERSVAIKVLPEAFATNLQLRARFEREAKTISQLNHPNICTVHDFGHQDGRSYLVMELVDGESLADRLRRGPLPLNDVFKYGAEIAEALESAHRSGVVHRDLKPGNVMLTRAGAKLLDFGLARTAATLESSGDAATEQQPLTGEGSIVGTLPYMSPEQLHGTEADRRTDIFALGAVIYEMLTGRRAFNAPSSASLIADILGHHPVRPSELQKITPPGLEHLVMTCLAKERDDRVQCAADVAYELKWLGKSQTDVSLSPVGERSASYRSRSWRYVAGATAVVVAAVGILVPMLWEVRGPEAGAPGSEIVFAQLTSDSGREFEPSIAPDGKMFAFVKIVNGQTDIFLQRVGGRTALNLTTESTADESEPAFSPDGSLIAFHSSRDGGGIFVMGATGESVRRLSGRGHNPAWSPDGKTLLYSTEKAFNPRHRYSKAELVAVDPANGATRSFYKGDAMQPRWSPNGRRVAFWNFDDRGNRNILTINSAGDPSSVVAVTADSFLDWNPVWSADGRHLYFCSERDGTMNVWRIALDEQTGVPAGKPVSVRSPTAHASFLSVSANGMSVLYQGSAVTGELLRMRLDPTSETLIADRAPAYSGSMSIAHVSPSPDGSLIAFTTAGQVEDLFVMAADGSSLRQLTSDVHLDRGVSWWPDGSRVAYYSNETGSFEGKSIRPDGSDSKVMRAAGLNMAKVSRDAKRVAFIHSGHARVGALAGTLITTSSPIPDTPLGPFYPQSWSPDGKLLAGNLWAPLGTRGTNGLFVYKFQDRTYQSGPRGVRAAAFLDDRRVIFADEDNRVGIFDVVAATVKYVGTVPVAAGAAVRTVGFSIDGRVLVVYAMRHEDDVWQMTLGDGKPPTE